MPRAWIGVSMHLLVLSAFRRRGQPARRKRTGRSQCTFWCSVLSDGAGNRRDGNGRDGLNAPFGAQCFPTLLQNYTKGSLIHSLNAPFGAQCFPTSVGKSTTQDGSASQCTFWCSVLSDRMTTSNSKPTAEQSQCTFWCSVLSDLGRKSTPTVQDPVSMHLLVLSAFRLHAV